MNTICTNKETETHEACTNASTKEIPKLEHSYTGKYQWNETDKTHSQMCVNGCEEYGNVTNCTFDSVVTDPTCDVKGYTTHTCTVCNNSYTDNETTRVHDYVYAAGNGIYHEVSCEYNNCTYKATEACAGGTATCIAKAICEKCNTAYGEVDAVNHTSLVKTDAIDATCETAGNIAYWTCNGCAKVYREETATTEITLAETVISAKNHDWNDGEITADPTCTTAGAKKFVCKNNSSHTKTETIEINTNAHNYGEWTQTSAPTCSATGTEERVCAHNAAHKETRDVEINANAHSYGEWTQTSAPTCSAKGTEERVCAHNAAHKETRDVEINANAHSYGEWTQTKAPTCTATGTEERVCANNAAHKETRDVAISATAHTGEENDIRNASAATCMSDGYTGDTYWSCCGKLSAKGTTINAIPHVDNNGDDICDYNCGTSMTSCKHEGPKQYITMLSPENKLNTHKIKCLECGKIVKTENCDKEITLVVDPTCYAEGYTAYKCKVCEYSYISDITPTTEHNFSDWVSNDANCDEIQTMSRRCKETRCLYKETEKVIDETTGKYAYGPHSLVVVPGKAATCTKAGYTAYSICVNCEEVTESTVIPAKGHTDANDDGNCDTCNYLISSKGECGCYCHGDSFFDKLIYKIAKFFWKLFKINANCQCGAKHW